MSLAHDLRYGARALRRDPGFTAVAVVTIALGIGASTAIWSVASGVLLAPLPYPEPERLVVVWMDNERLALAEDWHSFPMIEEYRDHAATIAELAVFNRRSATFAGGTGDASDAEWVPGAHASANLWSVLGVRPALGRVFTEEEDRPGADLVVVLSHALWQRRYGGREDVLGTTLLMNDEPREVIGVMPPGFAFPARDVQFWVPTAPSEQARTGRGSLWLQAIGRLAPGASRDQAQAELARINASMQERYPDEKGFGVNVVAYRDQVVGSIRPAIVVLLGAVGFVLAIASANVAGLLLARASAREREMALRAAIGGGRGRLVRQLLAESVVLALAGGLAGILVAWAGVEALVAIAPDDLPRLDSIAIDGGVLAFALALSVATGIAFGLVPALAAARIDPAPALKEGGRSVAPSGLRLRRGLVVAEIAVAVVLLVGAALMGRSFLELLGVDLGFRTERVLSASVALTGERWRGDEAGPVMAELYRELIARAESLPGVEGAAGTTALFLSATPSSTNFSIEGRPDPPPAERVEVPVDQVTPGYFRVMAVPLVAGRFFDQRDAADATPVAIVNTTMARRFWPGETAVGRRFKYGDADSEGAWRTIVGVVADTRRTGFERAVRPETYLPIAQAPARFVQLVVRTTGEPSAIVPELRAILRSLAPDVPLYSVEPVEETVAAMTAQRRLNTLLMAIFAAVAVALAAVGVYGVVAYSVERRTRELGVRAALGASRGDTLRLVLREGLALAAIGLAVGLVAAAGLGRAISSLLYGVGAGDPAAFATAAAAAAVSAFLACLVPALRAARVDPMTALRAE